MKNIATVILVVIAVSSFTACINHSDDHPARDTVGNRYGADTAKIERMNKDTAAVTTKTGSASDLDNSGSGGTDIAKDIAPKDTVQKRTQAEKK